MNAFRLFLGDQKISLPNFLVAVCMLALFGIAVNGLFEVWKLVPTVFLIFKGPVVVDWPTLITCLLPIVVFLFWMIVGVYPKLQALVSSNIQRSGSPTDVEPHRGIVVALSKPSEEVDDIVLKIQNAITPDTLYSIRGIGQTFKGMYHHNKILIRVWPLVTDDSRPYSSCIYGFVKKFMPNVIICDDNNICSIKSYDTELETIKSVKEKLAMIYSKDNLNSISLNHSDIIVDVTGGTKAISIGLTFGALDSAIDVQYVEQKNYKVIPLSITPEILLDKLSGYLLELYVKLNQERGKTD